MTNYALPIGNVKSKHYIRSGIYSAINLNYTTMTHVVYFDVECIDCGDKFQTLYSRYRYDGSINKCLCKKQYTRDTHPREYNYWNKLKRRVWTKLTSSVKPEWMASFNCFIKDVGPIPNNVTNPYQYKLEFDLLDNTNFVWRNETPDDRKYKKYKRSEELNVKGRKVGGQKIPERVRVPTVNFRDSTPIPHYRPKNQVMVNKVEQLYVDRVNLINQHMGRAK